MKRILTTVCALLLIGCAVTTRTEGTRIEKDHVLDLKPGTTTRQAVIEAFGAPTNTTYENKEEKLIYVFKERKVPVYLGGLVENETQKKESVSTLELVIRENIVYSYKFKNTEN